MISKYIIKKYLDKYKIIDIETGHVIATYQDKSSFVNFMKHIIESAMQSSVEELVEG